MCAAPATSREHAPPQCFFPEAKGLGRDLRRGLITVPSCDRHNSKKSKDDEYLRALILMTAAQSSEAARHQFFQKLLKAASRSPKAHGAFFRDKGTVSAGTQRALQIDRARFDTCIEHIARALFFHHYRRKWNLPIAVISPNFYRGIASDQMVPHQPTLDTVALSRHHLQAEPEHGANPEVFEYRVRYIEADNAYAFAARFYELFEVYTFSTPGIGESAQNSAGGGA